MISQRALRRRRHLLTPQWGNSQINTIQRQYWGLVLKTTFSISSLDFAFVVMILWRLKKKKKTGYFGRCHVIVSPSHETNKTHLSQESISKWLFFSLVLHLPLLSLLTFLRVISHKLQHEAFGLYLDLIPRSLGLRDQVNFTTPPVASKKNLHYQTAQAKCFCWGLFIVLQSSKCTFFINFIFFNPELTQYDG